MADLIDNTIKAEWTNADALDLQQTCNQLATDCISRQPETHEKRTETHECDCISRQAAIDAIKKSRFLVDAMAKIIKLPSAQPEIIACGDCKHWICHDRRCGYWNHGVKPLDWCCHGKRREDG